jgi:hypothetical protein
MPHRRLADMPGLCRALGGRGVPFETPLAGGIEGREALRRCKVFMGNLVLKWRKHQYDEATTQRPQYRTCRSSIRAQGNRILNHESKINTPGSNVLANLLDKQTEQTNPMSTMFL